MSRVLLLQLDGSLPNLALMRISSHHFMQGDSVEFRNVEEGASVERYLGDDFDRVYASAIFGKSKPLARRLLNVHPRAIIGGSGWDEEITLEKIGIETTAKDYSLYPEFRSSIGYTQRGCRLKCSFCAVPRMEGNVKAVSTVGGVWRGEPHPRDVVLLDNDFFGQADWQSLIDEMRTGGFRVSFSQGINARAIHDEEAAAIASVNYRSISMDAPRIYCAWDNRRDERTLFRGLSLLTKHGVKPDHLMVYVLIGYDHAMKAARPELMEDDFYRCRQLREFGARPYPMPYVRERELVRFQTWHVGAYDKSVSWEDWKRAGGEPRKLGKKPRGQMSLAFGE